ncbi:zinc finger protein with KRAB and SCAN domains 1-like [Dreissena polymorpha]|uniref:C2H2-type domain-containing protein n=1 Tax=Dreissena polymorpha TaxID=45954 RepID=A0A9D4J5K6_DREPO|nr:zinc finger protein with KRAB and SCAN domains 1-like [Dreissena polymorpha]XP_052219769.1 zinc finger protein with KRAB and SCAN domains 1-like [Dreissena polymorpha]XP_052219770.1 zinc finger protein with KRAB and SCAN domains 1-like [Dreissena polymorpha]XP_052219771.1 zinc finger protein with KRAB and SCAN domains 1-like [Dreissena polymorpha]KAH3796789.1 hypothetical protein DPMN_150360 [Dreissena polymorpha]
MEGTKEPELTQAVRIVLKYEIQSLLSRLSDTGEEYIVLTASTDNLTCGHIGSQKGEGFIQTSGLQSVKREFLDFCAGHKAETKPTAKPRPVQVPIHQIKSHRRKSTPRCRIQNPQSSEPPRCLEPNLSRPLPSPLPKESHMANESGFLSQAGDEESPCALDLSDKGSHFAYTFDGTPGAPVHNHTNGLVGGTMSGFVYEQSNLKQESSEGNLFVPDWNKMKHDGVAGQGNDADVKAEFPLSAADEEVKKEEPIDEDAALSTEQIAEQMAAATALVHHGLAFQRSPLKPKSTNRRKPRKAPIKISRIFHEAPDSFLGMTEESIAESGLGLVPELINQGLLTTDKKPGNTLVSLTNGLNERGKSTRPGLLDMKSAFEEIGNMAKCLICNKILANKNNRTFHWRSHVGDKRYTCDICNKAFTHPSNMRSHRKIHTDEKPFPCDLCDRRFRRRDYLVQHLERFHYNPKQELSMENPISAGGSESNSN